MDTPGIPISRRSPNFWRPILGQASAEHNAQAPIREDGHEQVEVHVAGVCVGPTRSDRAWEVYAIPVPSEKRVIPGLRFPCLASQCKVRLNNGSSPLIGGPH